jgi:hypothetical protein
MKAILAGLLIPMSLSYAGAAYAESGPVFGGPIGATDVSNALLPPKPGFYLSATEVFGRSDHLYNNQGQYASGSSAADVTAVYGQYVYPLKLFSGTLASGLQVGYETPGHVRIGDRVTPDKGWRDLYVDLLGWSKHFSPFFSYGRDPTRAVDAKIAYGLTIKAQYSMIFPTGRYTPSFLATPGNGTYFFIPNFAATYITYPDVVGGPLEFDGHVFLDVRNKNPATGYENGNIVDVDYAVVQHLKNWRLGVAGSYTTQVSDDRRQDVIVSPEGDRLNLITVGPIVSVAVPKYHVVFKVKAPFAVAGRDTLALSTVVANAFFAF